MQIPILSGVFTDEAPDFRVAYPRNMVPVSLNQGISNGYLRPADGILPFATGSGLDRGGIEWNGVCYRVSGSDFVRVNQDGSVDVLGSVAGSGFCSFDYSFDRLAIAAGGNLYYWNGDFSRVVDTDVGNVLDVIWVDGYFMTTDGSSLIVTELNDPNKVNPLKYGSSEVDPDPIKALKKIHDEPHAINRYSIEVFNNVGGPLFPFQRNDAAQIDRGAVGTHAVAVYRQGESDVLAFVGGGRNEPCAVWVGQNGNTAKISTREVDTILQGYTDAQLAEIVMESRIDKGHQHLMIHLPDQTLVYDSSASSESEQSVWFILTSSIAGLGQYRARGLVWCYGRWLCGDPSSPAIGELTPNVGTHYSSIVGWEFSTAILYNDSMGAIFHMLELVSLPGRVTLGADPVIWTSYTIDGETWSQEFPCSAGRQGERARRINWLRQGHMRNWRVQAFKGTSDAHIAIARLEAKLEPLNG